MHVLRNKCTNFFETQDLHYENFIYNTKKLHLIYNLYKSSPSDKIISYEKFIDYWNNIKIISSPIWYVINEHLINEKIKSLGYSKGNGFYENCYMDSNQIYHSKRSCNRLNARNKDCICIFCELYIYELLKYIRFDFRRFK